MFKTFQHYESSFFSIEHSSLFGIEQSKSMILWISKHDRGEVWTKASLRLFMRFAIQQLYTLEQLFCKSGVLEKARFLRFAI